MIKKGNTYYCPECDKGISTTKAPGEWITEFKRNHTHKRKEVKT